VDRTKLRQFFPFGCHLTIESMQLVRIQLRLSLIGEESATLIGESRCRPSRHKDRFIIDQSKDVLKDEIGIGKC
jgi:hypothetical protein